ncbi:MAG: AsmA family protein [Pseudoruegeria sp.]
MQRWIYSTLKWSLIGIVFLCLFIWAILATPLFSGWRKGVVADLLSEQIGQPFLIEGDARVRLGATTRIHVSGARIPSKGMTDVDLAALELLEWELDLPALMDGQIDIDNLMIDGLHVNLITRTDGTTSWTKSDAQLDIPTQTREETKKSEETHKQRKSPSILSFLADRTVSFTDIALVSRDETSGFVFDFLLASILLEQLQDGQLVSITGAGTLNGEEFTLDGKYPRDEPFTNSLEFGEISIAYDGSLQLGDKGGYTARLDLDTGQIGDVFDVLGLERAFEGVGKLSVDIVSQPGMLAFNNLETSLQLSKGQRILVSGDVANLISREGFDITVDARLHPEGKPPAKAGSLKEFKLTQIDAHIITENDNLAFENLEFQTNAIDHGLKRVGPISIGHIYRSEAKTLGLSELSIQAGPEDAPFIVANGDIGDVFNLRLVDLTGQLNGSADLLLKELSADDVAKFGGVQADFSIADDDGVLSLKHLNARTVDTDIWDLNAALVRARIEDLSGIKLDVSLGVPETDPFLTALGLSPVGIKQLKTGLSLEAKDKIADIGLKFQADDTDLNAEVSMDLSNDVNVIRGAILSHRMRLEDLKEGAKIVVQISERSKSSDDLDDTEDGRPPIQPLVLEKESEIFDLKRILTDTDLDLALAIKEFVGKAGISSMESQLIAKEGQIEFGPLELFYGPGFFNVTAMMDAIDDPERVRIQGATSGWDFGEILNAIDIEIPARGDLSASVDVSGNISSGKAFANSLVGNASVNLRSGAIATSLLELAGLGVFPWLISDELAAGQTQIVCVDAPVSINNGRVRFDSVVAETKSVQLVVKGEVDWIDDVIDVRAEPRRVGKPLSRSAWPFDVTGKLSEPKFKLNIGGSRSRRADGADEMPANRQPCKRDILQLK